MKAFIVLAVLLAVGCEDTKWQWISTTTCDKEVQKATFLSCLEKVPKGPDHLTAAANDWAEVVEEMVEECNNASQQIACTTVHEYKKIRP
jgi:hypothetical protein